VSAATVIDAGAVQASPGALITSPNQVSNRTAMGLPDSFASRLPHDLFATHRDLFGRSAGDLAAVAEDAAEPFPRRLVAGSVLALIGDPRLRPDDPAMISVPAARVRLGLPPGRVDQVVEQWRHVGVLPEWIAKECPQYEADIAAFRIARYPVTNAEYRLFLEDTDARWLPTSWRLGSYPYGRANHPVWTVRPEAADAYAAWLSARTGRQFRLPTEAEWEYAAGGGSREYPWGEHFRPEAANTVEAGPLTTTPVGIYPAGRSPFGALDMAGNVEEYVASAYCPYPAGEPVADDLSRAHGDYRIARGGSFTRYGDLARCRRRHGWYDKEIYAIGFRLAEG
jgi:formylglycine-generating enzyme required for sulfatase activity